ARAVRGGGLAALLLAATAACAGRPPSGMESVEPGWSEEGTASWYGPGFHGRPTASGEAFDMEAMTAAHPSLPLGTRVRVTVVETGRNTSVRVNDRGPFVDDRILDVSRAAARRLGFLEAGKARVRVEVVEPPPEDCWAVQVGSYSERRNARAMRRRLEEAGEPARLEPGPRGLSRVVAGPYGSRRDALRLRGEWGGVLRGCGEDR
ncbi:MAG: septal ring lytic transglycosylase RlpA family protein, partial [Gemmatimonadota bacterium]